MTDFTGDGGNNIFTGGADSDNATGGGGNDTLNGNGGSDTLAGGTGADTLNGGDGDDIVLSFDALNVYYAYDMMMSLDNGIEQDTLTGGTGDDILAAGYGDNINGGAGYNKLVISFLGATTGVTADFRTVQSGGSIVVGGGTITGITQTTNIQGSNYGDTIYSIGSYYGFSKLYGNGGNDQLFADYYTSVMLGGDGDDVVDGRGSGYLSEIYGEAGNDTLYAASGSNISYGGDGDDTIYSGSGVFGGNGNDHVIYSSGYYPQGVYGEAGNDLIEATGYGNDVISGGAGADTLSGADGDDVLVSADFDPNTYYVGYADKALEVDALTGGDGNDKLAIGFGDSANGGAGSDTLRLSLYGLANGVTFSTAGIVSGAPYVLGGGTIQGMETFEHLTGTAFADTLTITTQASLLTVDASDGNDIVVSANSSISLLGGYGDDRFVSGAAGDTFDGGDGIDTIDYANAASGVTVTLAMIAGTNGTGAGGDVLTYVENVNGSAHADTLNGNDEANTLDGKAGNDTLDGKGGNDKLFGGLGADTMTGGLGDDYFEVNHAGDVVSELAGGGSDLLVASVSYTLAAGQHVERLTLLNVAGALNLIGNEQANLISGNTYANVLSGGGGNDTLNGGAGNDTMIGELGDDVFYVDSASDVVVENTGEGTGDRVIATLSYTLLASAEVERLTTDNNAGTAAINLTGNQFAQTITGNAGANVLNGKGGADTLIGLGGDDLYYVDNAGDVVSEGAGQGANDRILASVHYTLGAGVQVERLTTIDNNATTAINLTGNALANLIYGNAGANVLNGAAGADTLVGMGGDDTYHVDNAGDLVSEGAGQGVTDRILASVSYTLRAGVQVEQLMTDNGAGTAAINFTGNELSNLLVGNAGANVLDGKAGVDSMAGLGGDDWYYVDNAGDSVTESAGGGANDRVLASVSYSLGSGVEVERLTTSSNGATTAINLTGNEFANMLYGNAGANVLDGGGGADTLIGLGGADSFAFTTSLGAGNVDTISGFDADDTIRLDNAMFTGLADGALAAGAFVIGTAAAEADDRIVYNSATGALLFDADGSGAGAAVQFATLAAGFALTSADFLVV